MKILTQPAHVVFSDCVLTVNPATAESSEFHYIVKPFEHFQADNVWNNPKTGQYLFADHLKSDPFPILEVHDRYVAAVKPTRRTKPGMIKNRSLVCPEALSKEENKALYSALYDPISLYISTHSSVMLYRAKGKVQLRPAHSLSCIEELSPRVLWQSAGLGDFTSSLKPFGFLHMTDNHVIKLTDLTTGGLNDRMVMSSLRQLRNTYANVGSITLWSFSI